MLKKGNTSDVKLDFFQKRPKCKNLQNLSTIVNYISIINVFSEN